MNAFATKCTRLPLTRTADFLRPRVEPTKKLLPDADSFGLFSCNEITNFPFSSFMFFSFLFVFRFATSQCFQLEHASELVSRNITSGLHHVELRKNRVDRTYYLVFAFFASGPNVNHLSSGRPFVSSRRKLAKPFWARTLKPRPISLAFRCREKRFEISVRVRP
jgi:hypothetical protein